MCIINSGTTTKYFSLGRGARQGDPISDLVILASEFLFILIKSKLEIERMTIFHYNYLYFAYVDDTTFYLKDIIFIKHIISIKHMVDTFFFLYFFVLKPNLRKSEIAGTGLLKEVQVAVCDMACIDLNNDTIKILGTYISFNKKLDEKKKLGCNKYSLNIENIKNEKGKLHFTLH